MAAWAAAERGLEAAATSAPRLALLALAVRAPDANPSCISEAPLFWLSYSPLASDGVRALSFALPPDTARPPLPLLLASALVRESHRVGELGV